MVDSLPGFPESRSTLEAVDIVCGTLQAKLITKELSSSTSRCVRLNGDLLTPCDLQRKAGKASSKNWKTTIRYQDQPISKFLVSYRDEMGRRRCRFEPNATLQASSRASLDPQSYYYYYYYYYCY